MNLSPAARAVFVELLVHGPLSRAEVARRLELSPSVLTKLTRPLLAEGFLVEEPGPAGCRGAPRCRCGSSPPEGPTRGSS
ncbi:hypothetical protein [Nonomuraea recticatena]|uniref:hypothetical protein n=1 Tax=Nonomuraea recticatena TaxID=46178 RepID=UPI00361A5E00